MKRGWILALYRIRLGRQIVQVLSIFKKNSSPEKISPALGNSGMRARTVRKVPLGYEPGHKIRVHGCIYEVSRFTTSGETRARGMRNENAARGARRRTADSHCGSQVAASCFPEGRIYHHVSRARPPVHESKFEKSKSKVVSARYFVYIGYIPGAKFSAFRD